VKNVYQQTRNRIYILLLAVDICLICFITWVFTNFWFPWFLFVWGVLGVVIFFLWRGTAQSREYFGIDKSTQSPSNTEQQIIVTKETIETKEEEKYTNLYPNV